MSQRLLRQRGTSLFEGLIAMLLMGIVGVGMTYVLSRSALSQTTVNAQNIVVNQVRAQLQSSTTGLSALCNGVTPAPIALNASNTVSATTASNCTMVQATVSVAGGTAKTVFVPQVAITASAPSDGSLLGGSLVITNNGSQ
ncbi:MULTISPECIES: PulJ/GspJ family protein [Silvimonas]|uniref:PulJ/GspJ family protein n=1 Tax=Silvimonas TaxID=300264 RepID=UPI0024B35F3E|nr:MULTISPECIES: hypothetical protein [Silvimonas]MDR3426274.1 hypothetical protein [Silvimonas sp.]